MRQRDADAGDAIQLRPQFFDDLVRRLAALFARLQIDVEPPSARVAGEGRDVRIVATDLHDLAHALDGRVVAHALCEFHAAADLPGVNARDETFRDDAEQIHGT